MGEGRWGSTTAIQVLKTYKFEENRGTTVIAKEPIGVCGFITPWNWPVNQIACKLASAGAHARPAARRRPQLLPSHAPIYRESFAKAESLPV